MSPSARRFALWGVVLLLLALLLWKMHAAHFDWAGFWRACRSVRWSLILLGTLIIYSNAVMRALRWSIFIKPALPREQRLPWWKLIGSQFIGFAGLAIFGRIGELIRPYLVSRRTGLPFSSQVAVVAVERIFDLSAFGILFAGNLLLSPELATLPYHERYHQFGWAIAGLTLFLIAFVVAVRLAGGVMAAAIGSLAGLVSKRAEGVVREKILQFRDGLNTVGSAGDFAAISAISLGMWCSIAMAYVAVLRAFPSPVHDLTVAHSLLLMGFSVVGGFVQLPGIGGGAQALTIGALTKLFGVPGELAASAGIILWMVLSMAIILPGLLFSRLEQTSLRSAARSSGEQAREDKA